MHSNRHRHAQGAVFDAPVRRRTPAVTLHCSLPSSSLNQHAASDPHARAQKNLRRAVDRNLMRRRFRAIYRTNKAAWPDRMDIVVLVLGTGAGSGELGRHCRHESM